MHAYIPQYAKKQQDNKAALIALIAALYLIYLLECHVNARINSDTDASTLYKKWWISVK